MSRYFSPLQKEVKKNISLPSVDIPDDYCQKNYATSAFPHQVFLKEYLKKYNVRGMLLYHEVGSGKTYTSILAVKELLSTGIYKKIYLIAPEVLYANYIFEIRKFLGESEKLQTSVSFIDVNNISKGNATSSTSYEDSIVVIDEVHIFMNKVITMDLPAMLLYKQLFNTKHIKILQLSATPIYNSPFEISPIFNLCAGKTILPVKGKEFADEYVDDILSGVWQEDKLRSLIEGYVSFYRGAAKNKTIYPQINRKYTIPLYITEKQKELISKLTGQTVLNYLPTQEILSAVDGDNIDQIESYSAKLKYVASEIQKTKGNIIIYTKFSNTVKILLKYFDLLALKDMSLVHLTTKNFDETIQKFNSKDNISGSQIKVVILDSHIRYGITLKNVKKLIIMEPYSIFNEIYQIIGRVQRICSHNDLPVSERFIEVQLLYVRDSLEWDIWITGLKFFKDNKQFLQILRDSAVDRLLYDDIEYKWLISDWLYKFGKW